MPRCTRPAVYSRRNVAPVGVFMYHPVVVFDTPAIASVADTAEQAMGLPCGYRAR